MDESDPNEEISRVFFCFNCFLGVHAGESSNVPLSDFQNHPYFPSLVGFWGTVYGQHVRRVGQTLDLNTLDATRFFDLLGSIKHGGKNMKESLFGVFTFLIIISTRALQDKAQKKIASWVQEYLKSGLEENNLPGGWVSMLQVLMSDLLTLTVASSFLAIGVLFITRVSFKRGWKP